ncbi:MAG: glutathione S-transferase N-terminal domain-containing protein [Aquisalimonadaceae bacterium]
MSVTLYEMAGANDLRFSPYCWRARMALAHKGITPERVGVRYTEKELIAFSGQGKVPILVDGDRAISDSWFIACHLEASYPDAPSLFGNAVGRGLSLYINTWADTRLNPLLMRLVLRDLVQRVDPVDREYFQETRLQRLGTTFEALDAQHDALLQKLREELAPMAQMLKQQFWFGGEGPTYADYIVFGTLLWARLASDEDLLDGQNEVRDWFAQLLELHDGLARNVTG